MVRTLASYLADLSQDELERMRTDIQRARERLEDEARGLAFEESLVTQALDRKSRRSSSSAASQRISRERVLELVNRAFTGPFNSTSVVQAFADEGIETNSEAVRQHLRRLADSGEIGRQGKGFAPLRQAARLALVASQQASPVGDGLPGGGREQQGFEVGT